VEVGGLPSKASSDKRTRPYLKKQTKRKKDWGCSSSEECLPNKHEALSSILYTANNKTKTTLEAKKVTIIMN
jgi:hypothetical protein